MPIVTMVFENIKTKPGVEPKKAKGTAGPLLHVPVVFIPGLKCSHLVDSSTGKRAWFTPGMLVRNKTYTSLELPLSFDENGYQNRDSLEPHTVVRHVQFGPRKYNIYSTCIDEMKAQGRHVRTFAYDWRRSLTETTELFIRVVEEVSASHGGARVQIVAHSMGGLITLAAVNSRPELFHSCLFAGTPFQPCAPMFLGYITNGRRSGLNKKMLTGRVHFSWLSPFSVYPQHGQGIVDPDGNSLQFDYYDPDTWVREQWGIFHPDHPETVVGTGEFEVCRDFLARALAEGKKFQSSIQKRHDIAYPPMAVIAGTGIPTRNYLIKDGPRAVCGIDEDSPKFTYFGDDMIQVPDTHLPDGIPHFHYTVKRAHAFLLTDLRLFNHVMHQLDARTRVPEPLHVYPRTHNGHFHPHFSVLSSHDEMKMPRSCQICASKTL